jgi:hypothetical protein
LALGRLGLQEDLGLPQPRQPAGLGGQRFGEFIPTGVAVLPVVALVGLGGLPQDLGDLGLIFCWVWLAALAALAVSLVPSRATTPRRTRRAAAHSFNDSTRKPARACWWRTRKRAIVT